MTDVASIDRSLIPGAMEHTLRRDLPDGTVIEFESAPHGWLKKDGEPRRKDWRAYFITEPGGKRRRLPSVSTLLDAVCPKPGLAPWSEARGIEGAVEAVRQGLITGACPNDEAVRTVRANGLGADRARDDAADRGLNVHALLEEFMRTGAAPSVHGHPPAHHGYIRALSRWLLYENPEPVAVEQIVAHPELGYAGRLDLRARKGDLLTTWDAKTQERAGIYLAAHAQCALYERAAVRCGDEPADRRAVVVFAANGEFRVMEATHPETFTDACLAWLTHARRIDSACESANRVERAARAA